MKNRFSWKCGDCGATSKKEPHWSLTEHMAARHGKRWAGEERGFVADEPAVCHCGLEMDKHYAFENHMAVEMIRHDDDH